jgi:hypothetical protein
MKHTRSYIRPPKLLILMTEQLNLEFNCFNTSTSRRRAKCLHPLSFKTHELAVQYYIQGESVGEETKVKVEFSRL